MFVSVCVIVILIIEPRFYVGIACGCKHRICLITLNFVSFGAYYYIVLHVFYNKLILELSLLQKH